MQNFGLIFGIISSVTCQFNFPFFNTQFNFPGNFGPQIQPPNNGFSQNPSQNNGFSQNPSQNNGFSQNPSQNNGFSQLPSQTIGFPTTNFQQPPQNNFQQFPQPSFPNQNFGFPQFPNQQQNLFPNFNPFGFQNPVIVNKIENEESSTFAPTQITVKPTPATLQSYKPSRMTTVRPTPKPQTTKTPPLKNPFRGEISRQKCIEYSKEIDKFFGFSGLAIDSQQQTGNLSKCIPSTSLVLGGVNADPAEFPHMAAIGYRDLSGKILFKGGGSLISERFVLTAAHCEDSDGSKASMVRLGDLNLKVKGEKMPELDVPVERFISHEKYDPDTSENDIALIKLIHIVELGMFIRPACLHQSREINKAKAIAIGWGLTEVAGQQSDILQKVLLDLYSNQKCRDLHNNIELYPVHDTQMCAGSIVGGKDTCTGDSGGPLQVTKSNECIYSIIGITSYGGFCGAKNSPAIYTRVEAYLDWIEERVWG